ncbi:MAG: NAD(P)H-hydrate dehydratase [Elusimicrobiaceae bacterium]|nr:NAD(P)H-hydrate dehydratase [Elusimicrobiaceae bacterium]
MSTLITTTQVRRWIPRRAQTAHKGDFGRVLVVAGSRTMCGAGFLCAKSALTAGAGLVYWALPKSMQPAFAAVLPEAITLPMPENEQGEIDASAWELFPEICANYKPSLLVVGPGMGQSPLLPLLLQNNALPLLVDADALNTLARQTAWHRSWPSERPAIFTPHAGEMARLLNSSVAASAAERHNQVEKLAQLTGGVCLLKGAATLVRGGSQLFENTTGGCALAKGGSGDVLAGLIAGLWAQLGTAEGFSLSTALKAAVCGVYLHGLAGELAAQTKSNYSVLAGDTLAAIAQSFIKIQESA